MQNLYIILLYNINVFFVNWANNTLDFDQVQRYDKDKIIPPECDTNLQESCSC